MDQCDQCGASLESGDLFCGECGAPLAGCPACGAPTVPGKRFCTACGHALAGAAQPQWPTGPLVLAAPAALGGRGKVAPVAERRVCSAGRGGRRPRSRRPLAARMAWELSDTAATLELLGMVDARQPGQLPRLLIAERDLACARVAGRDAAGTAGDSFTAAIRGLRERGTPYHLAHGLLDHADYLGEAGDTEAAAQAVDEAHGIAERLGCQPMLDRIDSMASTPPHVPVGRLDPAR